MWHLLLLACGTPAESYAVGVATLTERVYEAAASRAYSDACWEDPPGEPAWDAVTGSYAEGGYGGVTGLFDPWVGDFYASLAPNAAPRTWDVTMRWSDIAFREMGWGEASGVTCGDGAPADCAVTDDPRDFSFAGQLTGTLRFESADEQQGGEAPPCEDLLAVVVVELTGALDGDVALDLGVRADAREEDAGSRATGRIGDVDVDFTWDANPWD
jgi:hypothetical protein